MNPKLTWYGHSCFRLVFSAGGSVIFDPYSPGSVPGTELPDDLSADMVLCSHEHGDHNAAGRVKLSGNPPAFTLTAIDTFHDSEGGRLRGKNRISIVEYGGFRAAHLGDLGCALTPEQAAALQGLDLLLIPVGGFFTIGPEEARDIVAQLSPRVAVPMHYRLGSMGYDVIAELGSFTGLFPAVTEAGSTLEITGDLRGICVMTL